MKRVLAVLTSFICVIGILGCNDGNRFATAIVVSVLGVVLLGQTNRNITTSESNHRKRHVKWVM